MSQARTHPSGLAASKLAASIGLAGLLLAAFATMLDVGMRWFFNAPIYGLSDLFEIITPPIVASCFPAAIAARQNISIRFLGNALSARGGQAVEFVGQLVALVILVGLVWQLTAYALGIYNTGQTTWLLGVPVWPSWMLSSVLLMACIPLQILILIETWCHVRAGLGLQEEQADLLEVSEKAEGV